MGFVVVVVVVILGLIILGIVIRVVWFFIAAGMNVAELSGELSISSVRKKLHDPSLPAVDLWNIAYRTRASSSIWYDDIVQHPNCYTGLRDWMNELKQQKEYVPQPGSKYLVLDPTWKKRIKNFREPPRPAP